MSRGVVALIVTVALLLVALVLVYMHDKGRMADEPIDDRDARRLWAEATVIFYTAGWTAAISLGFFLDLSGEMSWGLLTIVPAIIAWRLTQRALRENSLPVVDREMLYKNVAIGFWVLVIPPVLFLAHSLG